MKKLFNLIIFILLGAVTFAKGPLYIGTNAEYPPYEYLENNKIVGLDADIIGELSKRVGFDYKWSNMNFDGLITALQSKKVDMVIAGMTVNKEREKFIDFSVPYMSPKVCYIVLKTSNINSSKDLENKRIGVELGTTEEGIAKKIPGGKILPFTGNTAALLALKADRIDVMLLDESVAKKYIENNPEIKSIGAATGENKAIAFNKKDKALKDKIDIELKKMVADGTIQRLKEKYEMWYYEYKFLYNRDF